MSKAKWTDWGRTTELRRVQLFARLAALLREWKLLSDTHVKGGRRFFEVCDGGIYLEWEVAPVQYSLLERGDQGLSKRESSKTHRSLCMQPALTRLCTS